MGNFCTNAVERFDNKKRETLYQTENKKQHIKIFDNTKKQRLYITTNLMTEQRYSFLERMKQQGLSYEILMHYERNQPLVICGNYTDYEKEIIRRMANVTDIGYHYQCA